jgi:hypothetical protein
MQFIKKTLAVHFTKQKSDEVHGCSDALHACDSVKLYFAGEDEHMKKLMQLTNINNVAH